MTALDFARTVRSDPAHGRVRVAVSTVLDAGEAAESFRAAGIVDILCKPVRRVELARAFAELKQADADIAQSPSAGPAGRRIRCSSCPSAAGLARH